MAVGWDNCPMSVMLAVGCDNCPMAVMLAVGWDNCPNVGYVGGGLGQLSP